MPKKIPIPPLEKKGPFWQKKEGAGCRLVWFPGGRGFPPLLIFLNRCRVAVRAGVCESCCPRRLPNNKSPLMKQNKKKEVKKISSFNKNKEQGLSRIFRYYCHSLKQNLPKREHVVAR